jgi:hypothetical protein
VVETDIAHCFEAIPHQLNTSICRELLLVGGETVEPDVDAAPSTTFSRTSPDLGTCTIDSGRNGYSAVVRLSRSLKGKRSSAPGGSGERTKQRFGWRGTRRRRSPRTSGRRLFESEE